MPDTNDEITSGLWNDAVTPDNYGDGKQYWEHLFEQYKICIEMADRVSQRRNLANSFFLTLHTLLFTTAGVLYEKGPRVTHAWLYVIPVLAALTLCYFWWRLVHSYRQLNTAKYKVIGEYERRLPTSPYWRAEWRALGEGKDPKLYREMTDVEKWVPIIFGGLYIIAGILVIWA